MLRQVGSRSASPANPQNAVQDRSPWFPRPSTAVAAGCWFRNKNVENSPLLVGEVSAAMTIH